MAQLQIAPRSPRDPRPVRLKRHTKLGKYRILKKLDTGGFADVFAARDEVLGIDVALKLPRVPHPSLIRDLRREVRLANRLDHPNVVRVCNADLIDGHFLIAYELGVETLSERLRRPLAVNAALSYSQQLLEALRYAHDRSIMHLDVKPENVILFRDGSIRLGDFGISRVAAKTQASHLSASGTLGYMAPEQAYGRPTLASDVFAAGLLMYRMFSGRLPSWPFRWPFAGHERFVRRAGPEVQAVVRRATRFDADQRYGDAAACADALTRAAARQRRARQPRPRVRRNGHPDGVRWRQIRFREFRRLAAEAGPFYDCYECGGPVVEAMSCCPWCGAAELSFREITPHPRYCPDCERGLAADWRYCPWCYGAGFTDTEPHRERKPRPKTARCRVNGCRGPLPNYARYCPWCRAKVSRRWTVASTGQRCGRCDGEVASDFWTVCAWCAEPLHP